jgi:hypothetical protein
MSIRDGPPRQSLIAESPAHIPCYLISDRILTFSRVEAVALDGIYGVQWGKNSVCIVVVLRSLWVLHGRPALSAKQDSADSDSTL